MAPAFLATLFFSYLAGLITLLNPCVLPLAPVVVAGGRAQDARAPFALAAGLALTFGVVGGLASAFGAEIGAIEAIRIPAAIIMIIVGLVLVLPMLGHGAERVLAPVQALGSRIEANVSTAGLFGQFLLGGLLALVWAPCVGPTLGAAIVLASGTGTLGLAILNMTVYALGTATSLMIAGFLVRKLAGSGRRFVGRTALIGRMLFGAILVFIGVIALTGLDQRIEGVVDNHLPNWFIAFVTQL